MEKNRGITVDLTAVIIRIRDSEPQVMTVQNPRSLPSGAFDPENHRTLELGLRSWVKEKTGQELDYVEQLYTYGNWHRNQEVLQGSRNVTVGYYALVPYVKTDRTLPGRWADLYTFFPWEDFRQGTPEVVKNVIKPALLEWVNEGGTLEIVSERKERIETAFNDFQCFGMSKVLLRFEILYEAGLVWEAIRDWDDWATDAVHRLPISSGKILDTDYRALSKSLGSPMEGDHRRILASTLGRVRGKISYNPIAFKLLPKEFTMLQIQQCYQGISGVILHKQNFRRYLKQWDFLEDTGELSTQFPGRPAAMYRFKGSTELNNQGFGLNLPIIRY